MGWLCVSYRPNAPALEERYCAKIRVGNGPLSGERRSQFRRALVGDQRVSRVGHPGIRPGHPVGSKGGGRRQEPRDKERRMDVG